MIDMKVDSSKGGGVHMKLVRRVTLAVGSIAALLLAGGAHFKVS
jgi:hypothetical protein